MREQRELGIEIAAGLGFEFINEFLGATQPQIIFGPVRNGDGYVTGEVDMTLKCKVDIQNLLIAVGAQRRASVEHSMAA